MKENERERPREKEKSYMKSDGRKTKNNTSEGRRNLPGS